jgi:hypothetical protein
MALTTDILLKNLPALFAALLVAILFIQSGIDKVVDWSGNLEFIKSHFSKSFLAPMVTPMLATITVMELATGFLSAAGIIYFVVTGSLSIAFVASVAGALSLTALFFGQRVAKDYAGAAVLVPYFILMILMMYLTTPALAR